MNASACRDACRSQPRTRLRRQSRLDACRTLFPLSSNDFGLQGAAWIPQVGSFVANKLAALGISGSNLNIAAHSWGTYVAQETGTDLLKTVSHQGAWKPINQLIALDPAAEGAEKTQTSSGSLDAPSGFFSGVASSSWAFYGSAYGNLSNTLTAQNSFVVLNPYVTFVDNRGSILTDLSAIAHPSANLKAHDAVVEAFARILKRDAQPVPDPVANDFKLGTVWSPNQVEFTTSVSDAPTSLVLISPHEI
jgi:pimeloyl-ACP methyl ester carboxylesterase